MRIVARGDAHDALELKSVATGASDDVHAAVERIVKVPLSAENRRRVQPFLHELETIEPRLREMTRKTADGSLNGIGSLGLRLADAMKRVQDRADAAGLRECADARQYGAVRDAFTAPVYATQFARFELWVGRALRPLKTAPVPRSPGFARYLARVGRVFDRAGKRLDDLYEYLPNRAVKEDTDLGFAIEDYESFLEGVADSLDGGRLVLTPVGVKQFGRAVAKHQRKLKRSIVRLRAAIGAEPLIAPDAATQTA